MLAACPAGFWCRGASCPVCGLFRDPRHLLSHAPPPSNASWPHIVSSPLLPRRRAHRPVQCGPALHNLGFLPHDLDALLSPQCVTGLSSGELCCRMVGQPDPRRPLQLVPRGPCTSHHCSMIHTAMHGHTEGLHALECPAPCGCCD